MLLETEDGPVSLDDEDLIKAEVQEDSDGVNAAITVHYIKYLDNCVWKKAEVTLRRDKQFCQALADDIEQKLNKLEGRPKRLLVLINPVSGQKKATEVYDTVVGPLFKLAEIKIDVIVSEKSGHLVEIVSSYDLDSVDGLVLFGGDGTFYECINTLVKRTQQEAEIDYNDPEAVFRVPTLPTGIIPTGTGNGVALTCCGTRESPETAALHIIKGIQRRFNIFKVYCDGKLLGTPAHILSYGLFTDFLVALDSKRSMLHRFWTRCYFLAKIFIANRQRVFNAEVQYKYKDTKTGNVISAEISGEYTNIASWVADMTTEAPLPQRFQMTGDSDNVKLLVYRHSSRLGFLDNIKKSVRLQSDWMISDFIEIHSVSEFKVKILGIDQFFEGLKAEKMAVEKLLSLDGDICLMTKPEFEVKLVSHFLPVYASRP